MTLLIVLRPTRPWQVRWELCARFSLILRQASGVSTHPSCLDFYQDLKLGKKYKYIIFNLNKENTEIIVEKSSDSTDYDDFVGDLPESECRYAVYDFEFEKEGAGKRKKIVFVSW